MIKVSIFIRIRSTGKGQDRPAAKKPLDEKERRKGEKEGRRKEKRKKEITVA